MESDAKYRLAGTRQRIIEVARRLFHARGYADVGVQDICRRARVAKGSFYHFFESKQELLDEVVQRNGLERLDPLAALNRTPYSGRDRLVRHLQSVLDDAHAQREGDGTVLGCPIGALGSEVALTHPPARQATAAWMQRWQAELRQAIRDGVGDGSISPTVDPEVTAEALLALIQGMAVLGRCHDDAGRLQAIAQLAMKRLLPARAG
ncbi:MAG: TetR/AcrR family transcriptional regulator [Xanthomonadales bacterium]|nr:TetR/AcrR family transcriptional regulator [Xanthomonadales bacterium]